MEPHEKPDEERPVDVIGDRRQPRVLEEQPGNILVIFFALLISVIILTILFASGILRFGQSGTVAYIVYVTAGLLTATLCYGILGATGTFEGEYHSNRLRLGGAIVALLVVAGGGGLYERYLRTPESFDLRIRFVSASGSPQALTGTVKLLLGAEQREAKLKETSDPLFQGIPTNRRGSLLRLSLDAPPYRLTGEKLNDLRISNDTLDVEVERDSSLVLAYSGTLSSPSPIRRIENAELDLVGTPCSALTDEKGYFTFEKCSEAERLVNPSVLVKLPGSDEPCPDQLNLQPLPRLSDLTIASDCTKRHSGPAAPPPPPPLPRPPGEGEEKGVKVIEQRTENGYEVRIMAEPQRPNPRQNYEVTVNVDPRRAGVTVLFWVLGSDGYRQESKAFTDEDGQFRFSVPGARDGVVDQVTAAVGSSRTTIRVVF